ncbi:MAG: C1 family peptidase [Saprospiraceae bacterium]
MKKTGLFFLLLLPFFLHAQGEPYEFKEVKMVQATPVKNQQKTGTCWAFSTASFLESEAIRQGKGEHDFSEMFAAWHIYRRKCENYVRRQGKANLSEGALAHDLLQVARDFGIVPESAYPGKKDPAAPHDHSKLEKDLQALCNELIALGAKGELPADWMKQIEKRLDDEFGAPPIKFSYNGAVFTPVTFRDYLGINPDDYVNLTSFTHHPFWTSFILEIPDNYANGSFYNLPLNELMRTLNVALRSGYSVEWDADVSNPGFSAGNGLAIVPEKKWEELAEADRKNRFNFWEPEKNVSQDYRQELFDRLITQDDHLMHIVGVLDEANSGMYYAVKNSWGEISEKKGFVYVSEAYMRLQTISITVHKDAVPKDILQRLGMVSAEQPKPAASPQDRLRSGDAQLAPQTNQLPMPSGAPPKASPPKKPAMKAAPSSKE